MNLEPGLSDDIIYSADNRRILDLSGIALNGSSSALAKIQFMSSAVLMWHRDRVGIEY